MEEKLKYYSYYRKSSEAEDRQVLSIEAQIDEMQKVEPNNPADEVKIITEAKSAKKPYNRPGFQSIVDGIEAVKGNAIKLWHCNRLSRNGIDTAIIIDLMDRGKLLQVITPTQVFRNFPNDKFMLNLFCSQAKLENDNKGVDVKRGMGKKARNGWLPGFAKLGYINYTDPHGNNTIVSDRERLDIIKQIFNLLLTKVHTPAEVYRIATKEYKLTTRPTKKYPQKVISRSQFYNLITDAFYTCRYEYPKGSGNWIEGKHEQILTTPQFDDIQLYLGRKGKRRPQKFRFAYTTLMNCGNCGAFVTAEIKTKRQKNGNVHTYVYYHCTKRKDEHCPEKLIRLEVLEAQIDQLISGLTISDKFHKLALKYLHEHRKTEANANQSALENKQKRHIYITQQLHNNAYIYVPRKCPQ